MVEVLTGKIGFFYNFVSFGDATHKGIFFKYQRIISSYDIIQMIFLFYIF